MPGNEDSQQLDLVIYLGGERHLVGTAVISKNSPYIPGYIYEILQFIRGEFVFQIPRRDYSDVTHVTPEEKLEAVLVLAKSELFVHNHAWAAYEAYKSLINGEEVETHRIVQEDKAVIEMFFDADDFRIGDYLIREPAGTWRVIPKTIFDSVYRKKD